MRLLLVTWVILSLLSAGTARGQGYELVWQDEFDGTSVDPARWEFQIGTGCPPLPCGWGNNELEYYRAENATVSGGFLTITAREESFGGADYTSARLRTRNLGDWKYGRLEMRARMPEGQGLWPAFWMLPTDETYGGWAASGEIDIMEYLGQDTDHVLGTIHYGGTWPANTFSSSGYTLPSGNFHDTFHTFALEWDPCGLRWYVDDVLYAERTDWYSLGGSYPAPFDQRFHLLLNLAVGGNLPGPPDQTTVFPQEYVIDYVRVYQEPGVDACLWDFDGLAGATYPLDDDHDRWFWFGGSVGGGGISINTVDLPPVDACGNSLEAGWGSGGTPGFQGGFGRYNPTDLSQATHFSFWLNPDAGQDYLLEINLQDDDNGDDWVPDIPDGADDEFQFSFHVAPSGGDAVSGGGWQRFSIPLTDFTDDNSYHYGGNGVFDPVPVSEGGNGQLANVVVAVISLSGADATFRTDRWVFTRNTGSVSGRVWDDADGNGNEDGGEAGLSGVTVELFDLSLGTVAEATATAGDGSYVFDTLMGGSYEVRVDPATLPPGLTPTFDPDGTGTEDVFALALGCDATVSGDFGYSSTALGVPGDSPGRLPVLRNFPNPFSRSTRISLDLASGGPVTLDIYSVTGSRIRTLVRGSLPPGPLETTWDGLLDSGRPAGDGIYYLVLRQDGRSWVRRMALLR